MLTAANLLAAAVLYAALSALAARLRAPRYPADLARVGAGRGFVAALTQMEGWIREGYERHSRQGRAFLVPGLLGTPPEVVVPRALMAWVLEQPDDAISTAAAHYDILNGDYSFVSRDVLGDPYHEHVVHRSLARHLAALVPALDARVRECADDIYGTGAGARAWRTVNIWDSLMRLIPRVTNVVLVGPELSRNDDYIDNMVAFTGDVTRDLMAFPLIPAALKPLLCRLAGLTSKLHYRRTARHTLPLIRQRLRDMQARARTTGGDDDDDDDDDGGGAGWAPPPDYVTWTIATAAAEGRADELDPARISRRLLPLNFAAIHTTAITALHALLDILAHDAEHGGATVAALAAEASRVLAGGPTPGRWDKAKLARLHRADSALRESMRVNAMAQTMVIRKVVAPAGVTLPATGQHLARGTVLSCPIWCAQRDRDVFGDDAHRFDPFRYSRPREDYEARPAADRDPAEALRLAKLGMVTTGLDNYGFGHGRHACPGRFFVAHELKMLIAYLVLNYDLRALAPRPPPNCVGRTMIPPTKATMDIRRKPATTGATL